MAREYPDISSFSLHKILDRSHYDRIIRIESQINKSMLSAIDKQAGRSGRLLRFYLHEGLAESILRKRLLEVFSPCGTHKTFTGAIQTVAAAYTNRKISKSEKEKLILFLKIISSQSLEMARNNCATPIGPVKTRSTFNKYVAQLTELGVALPLLPANSTLPALKPLFTRLNWSCFKTVAEWCKEIRRASADTLEKIMEKEQGEFDAQLIKALAEASETSSAFLLRESPCLPSQ